MNPVMRWAKFNLVGAIGVVVQLSSLALFNRIAPGHYLCETAAAIELTLLHNFLWHMRLTWSDRLDRSRWLSQLIRFHLSNGVVSLAGNLALTRLFRLQMHLPLLISNAGAIVCCSILNFVMSDRWTFAATSEGGNC